jgi:hypothetical protein
MPATAVSAEADQLEQALRAAGLDPDGALSWPVWNQFVHGGQRAALAAIENERSASLVTDVATVMREPQRTKYDPSTEERWG